MYKIRIILICFLLAFISLFYKPVYALDEEKDENSEVKTVNVYYDFVEANAENGYGYLPDEIYNLLPETITLLEGEEIPVPELVITEYEDYCFLGFNTPEKEKWSNDISVQGVWMNRNKSSSEIFLRAATVSGLGTSWTYQRNDGTGGYSRYQYTVNGSAAWCVEPNVAGWPLAGTRYEFIGTQSGKIAEIIGMGVKNGMSAGAIQAAVDRYAGHYSSSKDGTDTNPNASFYSTGGSYACSIDVYAPVGYEGEIQRLGTNPRCKQLNPTVKVKKVNSSSYAYNEFCPGMYSLKNAVYGVYKDVECENQIGTLTTSANGVSNSLELNEGTYYIKELTASLGYKLDQKVYTAVLTKGSNVTVTSYEEPYDDPTAIHLIKRSSNANGYTKYLDTAEFTLRYYDTYDDIEGKSPKLEWVFKPIIEDGEAMVYFDREHFVRGEENLFDENGSLKIPLGIFTIEETKAPQTYLRDPQIYAGKVFLEDEMVKVVVNEGVDLKVENTQLTQDEKVVILKTEASFKESGNNSYYADGLAHIVDAVAYENLENDKEYVIKGKVFEKHKELTYWSIDDYDNGMCLYEDIGTVRLLTYTEGALIKESETEFISEIKGNVEVIFEVELDDYPDSEFVVYEYLYAKDEPDRLISYHEDLYDEGQSVQIRPLYEAEFTLYKVSNMSRNIKLSGAYFDVYSSRTKRDGTVVDKYLGRYLTGGIYYEDDKPFKIKLYSDENLNELCETYTSQYDERFDKESVSILGLSDGTYYVLKDGSSSVNTWQIMKGSVYLGYQLEDTKLTFKELIAPSGYRLDKNDYTVDIGHDASKTRLENYRINAMIIPFEIPKTGVE